METVTSRDGTTIAYEAVGEGPPLVLVDGALCYRASGPARPLAAELREHFTVFTYDRRGRGDSTDGAQPPPYLVEREVEDLAAVIDAAGGRANLYGISSGAGLALEAAERGLPVPRLALYEAPFVVDATRPPVPDDFVEQTEALIAADRRGQAVRLFMRQGVRLPAPVVMMMGFMPAWRKLKGVAHTLPYDLHIVAPYQRGTALPADRWSSVTTTTLVAAGSKSPAWMQNGMRQLADVLPNAQHRTLEGQTHLVKPQALAPVLREFFTTDVTTSR